MGFTNIAEANDGEEALKKMLLAQQANAGYEILFLDIHMPGINGHTLLKKCKKSQDFKDISILMLTAEDSKEVIKDVLISGADDYIIKPPKEEILITKLAKVWEKKKVRTDGF